MSVLLDERTKNLLSEGTYNHNITNIKDTVRLLLGNLMNQYYIYVENKYNEKISNEKMMSLLSKTLKQMKSIIEDGNQFFETSGVITKGDIYTYVFAFSIPSFHFNNYIYQALTNTIKREFSEEEWQSHQLYNYEETSILPHEIILYKNISLGRIDIDTKTLTNILEHDIDANENDLVRIKNKLQLLMKMTNVMEDYNDDYCEFTNKPFQSNTKYLVDRVNWLTEYDKKWAKGRALVRR